ADALEAVDKQVLTILTTALDAENDRWIRQTGARAEKAKLSLVIDTIGIRPANSTQTDSSRIVATSLSAGHARGSGSGAHSLGETYDDGANGWLGPQWAALIVAALAGVR